LRTQCGHEAKSAGWRVGSNRLNHLIILGFFGEPGWDRTNDHLIKSQMLYR
jgi:hypothetical protein